MSEATPRFTFRPEEFGTGHFIRKHLMTVKENYIYAIWKAFIAHLEDYGVDSVRSSYPSFNRYMWVLKQLGLVELTRHEAGKTPFRRSYYRLVPGMDRIRDKAIKEKWDNPQYVLAMQRGWKSPRLGGRRYRKEVLHLPPKPRGRPRKEKV